MNAIVIIFYKAIKNSRLFFNIVNLNFFDFFYLELLLFSFIILYYNISKYQDSGKVMIFFNTKIAQNMYYLLN